MDSTSQTVNTVVKHLMWLLRSCLKSEKITPKMSKGLSWTGLETVLWGVWSGHLPGTEIQIKDAIKHNGKARTLNFFISTHTRVRISWPLLHGY